MTNYYFWLGKEWDEEIVMTMEFHSGETVQITCEFLDNWLNRAKK